MNRARAGGGLHPGMPMVVVDDDDAHRDLIAHLLTLVAPESPLLTFGPEVCDVLAEVAPFGALVLLDRRLGTRDSLELIGPLRRVRADLQVVVMSAFVTPEDRVACHAAGARDVFQKPGDLNGWRSVLMSLSEDDQALPQAA